MKRPPIIAIRVDEATFKRWEKLDKILPRGYKTTQARSYLLGLIQDLENDVRHTVEEAEGKGPSSSGGRGASICEACPPRRSLGCRGSATDAALCTEAARRESKRGSSAGEHPQGFSYTKVGSVPHECSPDPPTRERSEEAE